MKIREILRVKQYFALAVLLVGLSVSVYLAGKVQSLIKKAAVLPEAIYFVHSDHLGSTTVVSNSSGNAVSNRAYFPYGTTRTSSGSNLTDRLYTGQVSDTDDTGLYYYNARYYSPTIAKFTQADTVNDQLNRYAYVGSNPINKSDPSGHSERTEPETPIQTTAKSGQVERRKSMGSRNPIQFIDSRLEEAEAEFLGLKRDSSEQGYCFPECNYFPTRVSMLGVRENFEQVAGNWYLEAGGPNMKKFDLIVSLAKQAGFDPILLLSIWIHESAGSDYIGTCLHYGGEYCDQMLDFGYKNPEITTTLNKSGKVMEDHLVDQAQAVLNLPAYYLEKCPATSCPMQMFFSMYGYGSCDDPRAIDYMEKIMHIYDQLAPDREADPYYPVYISPENRQDSGVSQ